MPVPTTVRWNASILTNAIGVDGTLMSPVIVWPASCKVVELRQTVSTTQARKRSQLTDKIPTEYRQNSDTAMTKTGAAQKAAPVFGYSLVFSRSIFSAIAALM